MAAAILAIRERNRRRHELERGEEAEPTEEEKAQRMMTDLDADGDGNVTQEEIADYMSKQEKVKAAAAKAAAAEKANSSKRDMHVQWLPYREKVRNFYEHRGVQQTVAFVILLNFIAIVVEKSIDPYPQQYQVHTAVWLTIDDVCTVFFIVELAVNLYGSFLLPFFMSAWNWLDLVVVVVGTISLARVDLGSFARIKVLRAFRVLRLFKRVKSLNKILVALVKAIPGVLNAFLVMLIFMTIYAVLAVDLFRDFGQSSEYETFQTYGVADGQYGELCGVGAADCISGIKLDGKFTNSTMVTAMTPRGFYHGQEYYGDFFRALFTLFQVLTGESWSEAIVRPLLFGWSPMNAVTVAIFFTSYILLTQVVLQNVVVAVLLDKFVEDPDAKDGESQAEAESAEPLAEEGVPSPNGTLASPKALPVKSASRGPESRRRESGVGESEGVGELRVAMDKLARDQELMKSMLEQILSRMPPPPSMYTAASLEA